ncbi:B-box zinc finger protein 20-like [Miscanthus floridulus]|uniref:B-box zinc finger protein 20-like n=1 Tax=Miscanthus floridulus TaxID=154761 RepID=UPI00345A141C
MKVQCDVCAAEAASVFCCADEAALCDSCDRRVHRANKLAGKHRRFSLLNPAPPSSSSGSSAQKAPPPLCDICQEKRGLLFCKEDRAILCRDCDVSVHTASELTMRHTRFLLTGVRLSAEPAACPAPPSEDENSSGSGSGSGSFCCSAGGDAAAAPPSSAPATSHGSGSDNSSSISEYLIKTLPGWHVEDFLVDEAAAATNIGVSSADGGLARIGGLQDGGYSAWMAPEQLFSRGGGARGSREQWVSQMVMYNSTEVPVAGAGSKRSRATSAASSYSYW